MAKPLARASQDALNKAFRLFQSGQYHKAEKLARSVLGAYPSHVPLLQFVGILCHKQQKHEEALALFSKAVEIDPRSGEAHYNRGGALLSLDRCAEAVSSLERSLALRPGSYDALNNLGLALNGLHRYKEAEAVLRGAITIAPNAAAARFSLGLALEGQWRLEEAVASLRQAVELGYADPGAIYQNLGRVHGLCRESRAAIDCFQRALQYNPKSTAVLLSVAEAELRIGRYTDAASHYAAGLAIAPNDARFLTGLLHARRHVADWRDDDRLLRDLIGVIERGDASGSPFTLLSLWDEPALHLKCSRQYAARQGVHLTPADPYTRLAKQPEHKLRVAYVSNDFRHHATAALAAGLFENHDRESFETFAFSWEGDDSPLGRRLRATFDHFIDITATSDEDAARLIREAGIDIAVDLKGYTGGLRCGILAGRPAPIQVAFLGYPGTMGAHWIDYIVADHVVIPPDAEPHYSEKIVFLPDCYQVNDSKRERRAAAPARAGFGLPDSGFVFACFNSTHKIAPGAFKVWMRLLDRIPSSVLWLYRQGDDREGHIAAQNLRREAERHGVAADRLMFAPFAPMDEHLCRLQCADLFLDTWPYSAHTTASDSLWVGVPVLTWPGRSFQARVAASLLAAVRLPELVATSVADYEAIAFHLATNPSAYTSVRSRLNDARTSAALFDTARFTRNLEAAYKMMWSQYIAGGPPESIDLARSPSPSAG